jgi:hypothetical protein
MKHYRDIVEKYFSINIAEKNRKLKYVYARAIYFYLCDKYSKAHRTEVAESIDRHRCTVLHSLKTFPYMLKHDKQLKMDLYLIKQLANIKDSQREMSIKKLVNAYNNLLIKFDVLKTLYDREKNKQ